MELLSRTFRWLVSGIAFALGVGLVMICWSFAKEFAFPPPSVLVEPAPDISVVSLEPLTITVPAGVLATLSNSSTVSAYSPSSYELRILAGEKQLATCEPRGRSVQLKPGGTAKVQLTCAEVERAAVPPEATYKLVVRSAWRFK